MVVLDIPRSHDVGFRSFEFSQQPNWVLVLVLCDHDWLGMKQAGKMLYRVLA